MQTEAQLAEFLSLLSDAREQLTYLKELGVTGVEQAEASTVAPIVAIVVNTIVPATSDSSSSKPTSTTELFDDLTPQPIQIRKSSETFEQIWADIGNCTRCPLYERRTNIVHTDGNPKARLMFVGEAPGADEEIGR